VFLKNHLSSSYLFIFSLLLLINVTLSAAQTRIVVIPFYQENNDNQKDSVTHHYRRISGLINNQLVSHQFEVMNPFAIEWKEREFNELLKQSHKDAAFFCKEMCRKYSSDIAYVLWITNEQTTTPDEFCKVNVTLEGQGYDSASRDIGVYIAETLQTIHPDCNRAVFEAEKKIAALTGEQLSKMLQKNIPFTDNTIAIRLEGDILPEISELFGKILNVSRGVVEAKSYRFRIHSISVWRVTIDQTELFRLQSNILFLMRQIIQSNGHFQKNDVEFHYNDSVISALKRIQCKDSSSREILFVLDR